MSAKVRALEVLRNHLKLVFISGGHNFEHYFDGADGQYLADDKDEASVVINQKGLDLMKKKDFNGAMIKFEAARKICSNDYKDEYMYTENKDHAKAGSLNQEGDKLFDEKNFAAATTKYNAAYNVCPVGKIQSRNQYINNKAKSMNEEGNELFGKSNYKGAIEKYEAAFKACTETYELKNTFKHNRNHGKAALWNKEGDKLFKDHHYADALEKYDAAVSKCPATFHESQLKFKTNKEKALTSLGIQEKDVTTFVNTYHKKQEAEKKFSDYKKSKKSNSATAETIFNSFKEVIEKFIEVKAFGEAEATIESCKQHFPDKTAFYTSALQSISAGISG